MKSQRAGTTATASWPEGPPRIHDRDRKPQHFRVLAVRGATTIERDEAGEVRSATAELLTEMGETNSFDPSQIVSAIFTVTHDIRSEFPARAARDLNWNDIPCLCATEIPVPHAPPLCIRVLLHVETTLPVNGVKHVYLRKARSLRPDRCYD